MSDRTKQFFLVVNNSRLKFQDSEDRLRDFVAKRLSAFGVGTYEFLDTWDEVDKRINSLIELRSDVQIIK